MFFINRKAMDDGQQPSVILGLLIVALGTIFVTRTAQHSPEEMATLLTSVLLIIFGLGFFGLFELLHFGWFSRRFSKDKKDSTSECFHAFLTIINLLASLAVLFYLMKTIGFTVPDEMFAKPTCFGNSSSPNTYSLILMSSFVFDMVAWWAIMSIYEGFKKAHNWLKKRRNPKSEIPE